MVNAQPAARLVVCSVNDLAARYLRVLLSRRLLRAMAAATALGALMLLSMSVGLPAMLVLAESAPGAGGYLRLGLGALLLAAAGAAALGLILVYVRTLSALATGSRGAATVVIVITALWLALVAFRDLSALLLPPGDFPFRFLALAALFIHAVTAVVMAIGPFELRRSDEFSSAVLAEPRADSGLTAEIATLLDLPDVRAMKRTGRTRAWLLVTLSLMLEGVAFYTILKWASRLIDGAERRVPSAMNATVFVPSIVVLLIITLLVSFWLIRLILVAAKRLRLRARRRILQPAHDLVAVDPRPAVLFLRSFAEDQVPLRTARIPWVLRGFDPGAEYGTLEEMIVLRLTSVGPVVAVADPSRLDTPVGAARWTLQDEEWQQFVESQIRSARLIVVGVAETDGLRWEIEALRRSPGALARTIFVCPPGLTQNRALLSDLATAMGVSGAAGGGWEGERTDHVLAAALLPGGVPTVFVASELTEVAYYVALRSCIVGQRRAALARTA